MHATMGGKLPAGLIVGYPDYQIACLKSASALLGCSLLPVVQELLQVHAE